MDEVIQLEDLVAFYPPNDVEGIQTKITAKKEFKELESSPREELKRVRGDYFKHQKFIERFLQHYDRLLLFHETGTGKSCAITAAAEILKKEHQSADTDKFLSGGYIERAYVIVNNKQLKGRMKKEIICKCTDRVYDTPDVEESKQKVHRNLEKWYTVKEREAFARKLSKMTNRDIIDEYSNSIIFIDEAHNLRFRAFKGEKIRAETKAVKIKRRLLNRFLVKGLKDLAENLEIPVAGTKEDIINLLLDDEDIVTIKNINEAIESGSYAMSKKRKEKKEPVFGKESIYVQFWRLFHVARNIKVVLATATPMVNDSSEIKDLLNLLLPARTEDYPKFDRKLTTSELGPLFAISPDTKIEDMSEEELEYYFRGLVSYVRRLDTGADIEYQGIPISNIGGYPHAPDPGDYKTETKVFLARLENFQAKIYKQVRRIKQNELRDKERQVSNFVYPDGSFGLAGFNKYIRQRGDRYTVKNTPAGRKFTKQISTLDGIRNLGVKFANIIEIVNETRGNVFVYSNYSKASGAVPFSVCLEAQGYELFREDDMNSIFRPRFVTTAQAYCSGISGDRIIRDSFLAAGRERGDGTIQKPRYAFLTPDIGVNALEVLLTVMNSPENKHGDYIKVFITTPVGGEGISLNNVIGIHLIDGDWKHATNYQAESRAIRATSHNELLKEQSRVDVKVYNHAAYTCESSDIEVEEEEDIVYPCGEDELLSVDIRLYERSEEKDREIKRMERIMKKVAVDCQIHFLRNTRRDDPRIIGKDGTGECDYAECVYTCVDPKPTYEDYTTYDVYYINEPIEAVRRVLQEYFKTKFSITMEGILDLIWNDEYPYLYIDIPPQMKYIQYAVEEILTNKPIFQNRYGQSSYLQKDENTLFLSLDYPLSSVEAEEINVSDYTRNLIGIMDIPLENFENPEKEREQRKLLNKLKKYRIFSPEFEESFYKLDIDTLSGSLEDAINRHIDGKETTFSRKILERLEENLDPASKRGAASIDSKWFPVPFASLWHGVPKPVTELKKVEERLQEKSRGKGRKPKEGDRMPDEIDYEPIWDEETEPTYFHILYSIEPGRTDFNAVSNFNNVKGKIRLFIPSEGKWRDATPIEQVVYSKIGQERIEDFKQPYEDEPIHGFYISGPTKDFRLRVKFMEKQPRKKSAKKKKKDQRTVNRGRICESYSVEDLISILNFLEIPSPDLEELESIARLNREQLIDTITNSRGFKSFKPDKLDDRTLQYYLSWILFKPQGQKRKFICSIIQEILLRRGLVYQTY